jgi:hypothetical protein
LLYCYSRCHSASAHYTPIARDAFPATFADLKDYICDHPLLRLRPPGLVPSHSRQDGLESDSRAVEFDQALCEFPCHGRVAQTNVCPICIRIVIGSADVGLKMFLVLTARTTGCNSAAIPQRVSQVILWDGLWETVADWKHYRHFVPRIAIPLRRTAYSFSTPRGRACRPTRWLE